MLNVAIECISVWNIETSEWVSVSHPCTHGGAGEAGGGATVASLRPRVCFLNLHANSTRLLGNISCLVYTNNVRHRYKLCKGNTNASEHRPQVKHFANDHLCCNGPYRRLNYRVFLVSLGTRWHVRAPRRWIKNSFVARCQMRLAVWVYSKIHQSIDECKLYKSFSIFSEYHFVRTLDTF